MRIVCVLSQSVESLLVRTSQKAAVKGLAPTAVPTVSQRVLCKESISKSVQN